ncbi:MAG: Xaa-Pro peptidase family protein [Candidatus Eremiobacteraeota bacterium]|nr:Xaa-Pro peptidase family protein [Candidatus Eremiobacteraeota bacterium]
MLIESIVTRLKKLRSKMQQENINSVLITGEKNRQYYSGFTGSNGWLVITGDSALVITDGRYFEQVGREAPLFTLVKAKQSYRKSIIDAMSEIVENHPVGKTMGYESSILSVAIYNELLKALPDIKFAPFDNEIESTREIKEPAEIEIIKKAIQIAQEGFKQIESKVKAGATEREISAELQYRMKLSGADKEAFDIIVAAGKNSALPHAKVSDCKLKEGDPVVIDWGAKVEGYHSDMTRTLFVGKPSDKMREIYNTVFEAQRKALDVIGPGMSSGEVDAVAREHISSAGYGDYFVHGLGHGVGLAIHERPSVKKDDKTILQPGMVATVEPGIYVPDLGGVRIEDMVLITPDGKEILTSLPIMKY